MVRPESRAVNAARAFPWTQTLTPEARSRRTDYGLPVLSLCGSIKLGENLVRRIIPGAA